MTVRMTKMVTTMTLVMRTGAVYAMEDFLFGQAQPYIALASRRRPTLQNNLFTDFAQTFCTSRGMGLRPL